MSRFAEALALAFLAAAGAGLWEIAKDAYKDAKKPREKQCPRCKGAGTVPE